MAKQYIVDVPGVPRSPSPISNAVVCGTTCYISGQLAVFDDGYRSGTAAEEARRAFDLVFQIAEFAGFEREDIVYVDVAFTDLERDLPALNKIFDEIFAAKPARTIYQAAALPFGAKVKVQAIAVRC
jgi:2-iminobutanoate/2-iminopropanoate deaminase